MSLTSVHPPSNSAHPALGADKALAELTFGAVYTGTIDEVDPVKQTYTVTVDHLAGPPIPGCQSAVGIFCALLGIRTHLVLTPGTRVKLVYDNPVFILATLPSESPDLASGGDRTLTHSKDTFDVEMPAGENPGNRVGATPGQDFFPGEFEIGNQLGVAIQFLTSVIKMQAGDRAKVECMLLDNLVRIVCDTFQSQSCFGEYTVVNGGGGPTVIAHGTSKTGDSWGLADQAGEKAKVDKRHVEPDAVAETGRNRMSSYFGYLGDFVHMIIADPEKAIGQLAQNRAGKFDCHVNNDGSLVVRSVADISFERVCVIPVPIQRKGTDAKDGNTVEEIEEAVKRGGLDLDRLLKRWDYGATHDRLHLLPYQLREYARYLAQFHAYARMLAQDKDFELQSESTAPTPSYNNGEDDVARANPGKNDYYPTYSAIRILRDGSQVHQDGWGNAIMLCKNGITMSSSRHFDIEAAGDFRVAARNIYFVARRHVEISAAIGGLILKSRTFMRMLCQWGSIHVKSEAPDLSDPNIASLRKTKADQPVPEEDPEPEILDQAIVMECAKGAFGLTAARAVHIESTGAMLRDSEKSDPNNKAGNVIIQASQQDVFVRGARNVWLDAAGVVESARTGLLGLKAKMSLLFHALHSDGGLKVSTPGIVDINKRLTIRKGTVVATQMRLDRLAVSQAIYGPERGPSDITGTVGSHLNHIAKYEDAPDKLKEAEVATDAELKDLTYQTDRGFPRVALSTKPLAWNYLPPRDYLPADEMPWRSITQERLKDDTTLQADYLDWNWAADNRLTGGGKTGDRYPDPWYGATPEWQYFEHTQPLLSEKSSTNPKQLDTAPTETKTGRVMRMLKQK